MRRSHSEAVGFLRRSSWVIVAVKPLVVQKRMANRGRALEDLLETVFNSDPETCMFRQANRVVLLRDGKAFPQKGAPVDFVGVIKGVPVAVECKETKRSRLPLNKSRFPPKEIAALLEFAEKGGRSFVVAAFWKHGTMAVYGFESFKELLKIKKSVALEDADSVLPLEESKKVIRVLSALF